jgi:NAD(P)H-dependent FMN reductase
VTPIGAIRHADHGAAYAQVRRFTGGGRRGQTGASGRPGRFTASRLHKLHRAQGGVGGCDCVRGRGSADLGPYLGLPLYTSEHATPAGAHEFADAVYRCDALIWSSPTYHGSVSGSFKNALDWLILLAERDPPYLSNKPIGLVSTAGGVQGLQAVNSMEFIARALRGWSVPLVLPVPQAWRSFDRTGSSPMRPSPANCAPSAPRSCVPPASSRPKAPAITPTTGSSLATTMLSAL